MPTDLAKCLPCALSVQERKASRWLGIRAPELGTQVPYRAYRRYLEDAADAALRAVAAEAGTDEPCGAPALVPPARPKGSPQGLQSSRKLTHSLTLRTKSMPGPYREHLLARGGRLCLADALEILLVSADS